MLHGNGRDAQTPDLVRICLILGGNYLDRLVTAQSIERDLRFKRVPQNSGVSPFSYPFNSTGYTLATCPNFPDHFIRLRAVCGTRMIGVTYQKGVTLTSRNFAAETLGLDLSRRSQDRTHPAEFTW